MNIRFDIDGWLLGFHKKLARSPDPKSIIGRFILTFDFKAVFVNDIFIGFCMTPLVEYIPAQCLKEWVKELAPQLRLVVSPCTVRIAVLIKTLDQLSNILWCGHGQPRFLVILFQAYSQIPLSASTKPFQD